MTERMKQYRQPRRTEPVRRPRRMRQQFPRDDWHELEQYAWRQAHRFVSPASDRDDAVQEAMLAVWTVETSSPRSANYLQGVIYKRVADFAKTRRHSGSEQPRGSKAVDVLRKQAWIDPRGEGLPDHEIDGMFGNTPSAESSVGDPLERDRIHAAIRTLAPHHREQVFRRFWMGDPGNTVLNARWRLTIRPKLADFLSA